MSENGRYYDFQIHHNSAIKIEGPDPKCLKVVYYVYYYLNSINALLS